MPCARRSRKNSTAPARARQNSTASLTPALTRPREKKKPVTTEGPYDPFGGLEFTPSRYRVLPGVHTHPGIDKYKSDPAHVTGGYGFDDYTARAMFEAFAGLAVFVEDEKEVGVGLSAGEVATMSAGIAAVGDKMDLD
ncbi:hypothetical protein VTJ49DRAFT_6346 [Mycothermus thermophilus]|uniref:Uncharacterized protein n=1 Tax=Humicola insolens TaxID=85995 RepID=A0ABR3V1D1_HUMIN